MVWEDNTYGEPIVVSDAQPLRELSLRDRLSEWLPRD